MKKTVLNYLMFATLALMSVAFTSCKNKSTDNAKSLEDSPKKEAIFNDPQFDIYGTWEHVIDKNTPHEWLIAPPTIMISETDESVSALFYESRYNGLISGTDKHQISVHMTSGMAEGEAFEVDEEWILNYDPKTNRLKYGEMTFRKKTEYEFSRDIWHNDKFLTLMTVFYSVVADEEYRLDSLTFWYDNAMQTVRLNRLETPLIFWNIDPYEFQLVSFDDYNFNGYLDVAVFNTIYSGSYNSAYEIFLYDPKKKNYTYHPALSEMLGAWVDAETKTIKTHSKGGHAGLIFYFAEYRWDKGNLMLIQSVTQDWSDELDKYVLVTRTLQKDGSWEEMKTLRTTEEIEREGI